ncbi:Transmembrane protein 41 [Thelohanellus kitauei]|uniref:Transmembrane protein 41 n=1 Tax=Thelohanellus kitauei TaxID=669202 RepID=A0A0C2INS7_THEKT|nr:Transmembrane protein 41 [Thelohanellus kitauei]
MTRIRILFIFITIIIISTISYGIFVHKKLIHRLKAMDLKNKGMKLTKECINNNPYWCAVLLSIFSITLQSLASPGSLAVVMIMGFYFNPVFAIIHSTICAVLGSFFSYFIFQILAKSSCFCGDSIKKYQQAIEKQKNVFWFLLILKVNPFIPLTIINAAVSILAIPLKHHLVTTLLGVIPRNVFYIIPMKGASEILQIEGHFYKPKTIFLFTTYTLVCIYGFFKCKFKPQSV